MGTELIPAVDAFPIPGPTWLFQVLLVFTFFVHLLFMNLTLGGTLLAAVAQLLSGGRDGDYRTVLAGRLTAVNTYGISMTITTGVAPLLFVQVLFQQYFYVATILIAWVWLLLLLVLMVGYYAVYLYKFKGVPARGSGGGIWLVVAALMFLLVAMVQVAVNLIHSQPEKWGAVADAPWSILADPAYFVRLLHFLLAAVALSGLVMAWWAVRAAGRGEEVELNGRIARFGWRWALWATLLQVVDGIILLLVLPRHVLQSLMGGELGALALLGISILLGLGLIAMLARVIDPVDSPGLVSGTLAILVLTVGFMAVTRHQVRLLSLQPVAGRYELATASQWGNFVLFALLLVAGLVTIYLMVRRVLASPAAGEEAA